MSPFSGGGGTTSPNDDIDTGSGISSSYSNHILDRENVGTSGDLTTGNVRGESMDNMVNEDFNQFLNGDDH